MIKIGTRKSPLALVQAEMVKAALIKKANYTADRIEIVPMSTTGDEITDRRLMLIGGKGLFTKEIEEALLNRQIDLAVHSMKDVATYLPDGLVIPCCLPRNDVRDTWISDKADHPRNLPVGSIVGTSSLRRAAQVLHMNPQLKVVTLRGNVQTRIRKLQEGQADATILAMAGLQRLDLTHVATHIFSVEEMLPAPAQGAIGIQCRVGDLNMLGVLNTINDDATKTCVEIERAFLAKLDGSCRTPIAALAQIDGDICHFTGMMSDPCGKVILRDEISSSLSEMKAKAESLANRWYEEYSVDLFREDVAE